MHNIIYPKMNLVLESYSTLSQLANPDHESNIRRIFATNTQPPHEKQLFIDKFLYYFDEVNKNLHLPSERVQFFFSEQSDTFSMECHGKIFLKVCLEETFLDTLVERVKAFTPTERFAHIRPSMVSLLSQTPESLMMVDQLIVSEADLFNQIFQHPELSDQQKYDSFYIYHHYEILLEEFIHLIRSTQKVIEPLLVVFEKEVNELILEIEPLLLANGINYFAQQFKINLGKDSHYRCYPSIVSALSISFTNIASSIDTFNVFFGIYVLPFMRLNESEGPTEREIGDFLKALADPSKMHILKLLQKDRLYASQLAEKLGISNATISHHMNALLQLGIIKYEKEQTKFYYSLESKKLQHYLHALNQQFEY